MTKAIIAALTTMSIDLKVGQAFDHHEIVLIKDGISGDPVNTSDPEITFTDLEPGSYKATGFSVDKNGDQMSDLITSNEIVINPEPAGQAQVLSSITLKFDETFDGTKS